jgi:N-acyl-phosphatidylethanolamine-hydrolysing phospholipase D
LSDFDRIDSLFRLTTRVSGLKAWFTASGIPANRVTELDWYHETLLTLPSPDSPLAGPTSPRDPSLQYPPYEIPVPSVDLKAALTLKIAFTPAQHRSGRGFFDHMSTLWGSWCVGVVEESDAERALEAGMKEWEGFKVFFGG